MVSFFLESQMFFLNDFFQSSEFQHHGCHAVPSHEQILDILDEHFEEVPMSLAFVELLALLFVIPPPKPPRTTSISRWFLERGRVFHSHLGFEQVAQSLKVGFARQP